MAILQINGVDMPSPSEMQITVAPLGKSETNAAGHTVFDRVAVKRKIQLKWLMLPPADFQVLLSSCQGETFFDLTFFDGPTQQMETASFTASAVAYRSGPYAGTSPRYFLDIAITMEEK